MNTYPALWTLDSPRHLPSITRELAIFSWPASQKKPLDEHNKTKLTYTFAPLADTSSAQVAEFLCSLYFRLEGYAKSADRVLLRNAAIDAIEYWGR